MMWFVQTTLVIALGVGLFMMALTFQAFRESEKEKTKKFNAIVEPEPEKKDKISGPFRTPGKVEEDSSSIDLPSHPALLAAAAFSSPELIAAAARSREARRNKAAPRPMSAKEALDKVECLKNAYKDYSPEQKNNLWNKHVAGKLNKAIRERKYKASIHIESHIIFDVLVAYAKELEYKVEDARPRYSFFTIRW